MGSGKSAATLSALQNLSVVDDVYPALIVAPLRVARDTWPDEFSKWDDFKDLRVSPIVGNVSERKHAALKRSEYYTINYENIEWLRDLHGDHWPFRTIIADEASKLRNFRTRQGGKRSKALAQVAHSRTKRFIELTGTPSANGLTWLWGQLYFLDKGERLGRSYTAFEQRWFRTGFNGFSIEPFDHSEREIHERIKDICLTVDIADYVDIGKSIVHNIYVELPSKARALYRDMEREMFMELKGHEVEAFNAASRTNKCLQLSNGAAYVNDEGKWEEVHTEKLQALESIVNEANGMPVLVSYNFVSDKERLLRAFPKAVDLATKEGMKQFKAGKSPIGIGHPASIGHGVDGLQDVTNILVVFGMGWDLELYDQFLGRIGPIRQFQSGHKRPVYVYHILARDTMDEVVLERLEKKRPVQDLLLEAMKRFG